MKKLLLLPALLLTLISCSSDDAVTGFQEENTTATDFLAESTNRPEIPPCVDGLSAYTVINVSNGFGNPLVEFHSAGMQNLVKRKYEMQVHVQALSDCDDLESGTGDIIVMPAGTFYLSTDQLLKTVSPSQLPSGCYRWRILAGGTSTTTNFCISMSPWYEAPLF